MLRIWRRYCDMSRLSLPCWVQLSHCQVGLLRALPRGSCFTLLPFIGSLFFEFSCGITPCTTCSRLTFLLNGAPPFLYAPLLTFQIFQARSPMWSHRRRHKSWGLGYQHQMILLSMHDGKLSSVHRHRGALQESHMILSRNYGGWLALRLMRGYAPWAFVSFLVLRTDNRTMIIDVLGA